MNPRQIFMARFLRLIQSILNGSGAARREACRRSPPASAAVVHKRTVSNESLQRALASTKKQYGQTIKDLASL